MSTDYDCWKEDEEHVSVEMLISNLTTNSSNAKKMLKLLLKYLGQERGCDCSSASKFAMITAEDVRDNEQQNRLKKLFPDYF